MVSVVVPALDCADDVDGFVDAISRQRYPVERRELIVVDNGSTDATVARLKARGIEAAASPERGRSRALNVGIAQATGTILCTTDLSCRPCPDWIWRVVECFGDPTVGCVAGDIELLPDGGGLALRYQARTNYMSPFHALERRQLPFLPFADGANACFRRAVFDAIGLFDESFYKGADVEFCYRMFVLTDYKLAFCRRAVVREAGEPTIGALLRQRFRIGMGSHLLRIKYPEFFLHHTPAGPVRRGYWRLLDACRRLRVPHGAPRPIGWSALQDGAVEFLMSRAQAFGRLYGRRELGRRKQVPARVDPDRAQRFVSAFDRFDERVLLV